MGASKGRGSVAHTTAVVVRLAVNNRKILFAETSESDLATQRQRSRTCRSPTRRPPDRLRCFCCRGQTAKIDHASSEISEHTTFNFVEFIP